MWAKLTEAKKKFKSFKEIHEKIGSHDIKIIGKNLKRKKKQSVAFFRLRLKKQRGAPVGLPALLPGSGAQTFSARQGTRSILSTFYCINSSFIFLSQGVRWEKRTLSTSVSEWIWNKLATRITSARAVIRFWTPLTDSFYGHHGGIQVSFYPNLSLVPIYAKGKPTCLLWWGLAASNKQSSKITTAQTS